MGVGQATLGQGMVLSRSSQKTRRQESRLLSLPTPLDSGEKADLVFYDSWLLILGHPFTKALENTTSSESQELHGLLTKRVT